MLSMSFLFQNAKTSCGEKCGEVAPTETENICDYLDVSPQCISYQINLY
jgi:hypothetical protein